MNFIDRILIHRFYHILCVFALILIYSQALTNIKGVPIAGYFLILSLEVVLLWARKSWLSTWKYILIASLTIIVALSFQYGYGVETSVVLWPLTWAFGAMPKKYGNLSIILALSTITVILLMSYNSTFQTLFNLVGIYLGIRSIVIRKDAYKTSELHLQELNEAHRELQEAHRELQEASVNSMKYAVLEERTRLAREIHDGIGHQLTSLIVQLQALEIALFEDQKKSSELVNQLLQISRQTMAEVRMAVKEWSDDEMGLGLIALKGIVSQMQARSSIKFKFIQESDITEWSNDTSITLYRVLQESLTNILRHSNALAVDIHIKETDDFISLIVSDDGKYTENTPLSPGFGMRGIMERCSSQGGTCTITPRNPHGMCIEAVLPIKFETNISAYEGRRS